MFGCQGDKESCNITFWLSTWWVFKLSLESWWNGSVCKSVYHARPKYWIKSLKPIAEGQNWFHQCCSLISTYTLWYGAKSTCTQVHINNKIKITMETNPGKWMRELIDLVNWSGKPTLHMYWTIPWVDLPEWIERTKCTETYNHFVASLTVDAEKLTTSYSSCHAFAVTNCILSNCKPNKHATLYVASCQVFDHSYKYLTQ